MLNEGTAAAADEERAARVAGWQAALRKPFPENVVCYKPTIWCAACRNAQGRVCNDHKRVRCAGCKQNITEAHLHLDYVGHADTTSRLLEVDPYWTWEPAYRQVSDEVMMAAIASGRPEIVNAVIANAPAALDGNGGMWMVLTLHDPDGYEVSRLCYGDAQGKLGPNAVKEMIGDGVRNGAMRFGVALDLWSRAERKEAEAPDSADKAARAPRAPRAAGKGGPASAVVAVDPKVQAIADLAVKLATGGITAEMIKQHGTAAEVLRVTVYEEARKQGVLTAKCIDPVTGEATSLTKVITAAKTTITDQAAKEAAGR